MTEWKVKVVAVFRRFTAFLSSIVTETKLQQETIVFCTNFFFDMCCCICVAVPGQSVCSQDGAYTSISHLTDFHIQWGKNLACIFIFNTAIPCINCIMGKGKLLSGQLCCLTARRKRHTFLSSVNSYHVPFLLVFTLVSS